MREPPKLCFAPPSAMLPQFTAEQFVDRRFDMPDAGQWSELVGGIPIQFEPPGVDEGNALLNLSKAFAAYVQRTERGYPCFGLGLLMERRPDTVRFPAVSYYLTGRRFAESDKVFTTTVPDLVVEVRAACPPGSTRERVQELLEWGVSEVWSVSTREQSVTVHTPAADPLRFKEPESVLSRPMLPEFAIRMSDLFAVPEWWT